MMSDFTDHEMNRMKNKKAPKKDIDKRANYNVTFDGDIPESVNWVEKGAVSPPDQMFICAAGWAISASSAIESSHFTKTGTLTRLSSQQCIDCATEMGENWDNCDGGYTDDCMFYGLSHPLNTYADVPFIHMN
jgi:cathepsin L